jgi:hypothetical protein
MESFEVLLGVLFFTVITLGVGLAALYYLDKDAGRLDR